MQQRGRGIGPMPPDRQTPQSPDRDDVRPQTASPTARAKQKVLEGEQNNRPLVPYNAPALRKDPGPSPAGISIYPSRQGIGPGRRGWMPYPAASPPQRLCSSIAPQRESCTGMHADLRTAHWRTDAGVVQLASG